MSGNIFVCYPRCTTCKKAEKWLAEKWLAEQGIAVAVRDILLKNIH